MAYYLLLVGPSAPPMATYCAANGATTTDKAAAYTFTRKVMAEQCAAHLTSALAFTGNYDSSFIVVS